MPFEPFPPQSYILVEEIFTPPFNLLPSLVPPFPKINNLLPNIKSLGPVSALTNALVNFQTQFLPEGNEHLMSIYIMAGTGQVLNIHDHFYSS